MSELALAAYVRIVTNHRAFNPPVPIESALGHVQSLVDRPNCVLIRPASRHLGIFSQLCRQANATGNLVADAYFAALAIESRCRWYTFDRDYARFPGLDWAMPDLAAPTA